MIPRNRPAPAPKPTEPDRPDGLPDVEHRCTDLDFHFSGEIVPVTLNEGDTITETDDRFLVTYANGEIVTIYKRDVRWTLRRERVYFTPPEPFEPGE